MLRTFLFSRLRNDIDEDDRRARSMEAIFQGMGLKAATQSYSYALSSTKVRVPLSLLSYIRSFGSCTEFEWDQRVCDLASAQDRWCGSSCTQCFVVESSEGREGREEGECSRRGDRVGPRQLPSE